MGSRPKENKLVLRWCKREKDWKVWYPRKCDGALVMYHIADPHADKETPLLEELVKRGYDRCSIRLEATLRKEDARG